MFVGTAIFEYQPSFGAFQNRFASKISPTDTFVYCDSSFGIMAYYYPEHTHLCTYQEAWFSAFDNVTCIDKNQITAEANTEGTIWFVKKEQKATPIFATQTKFDCAFRRPQH